MESGADAPPSLAADRAECVARSDSRWSRVKSAVANVDLPQQVACVGTIRSHHGTAGDEFLAMTVCPDDR